MNNQFINLCKTLNEGYGTYYERLALTTLLNRVIRDNNIHSLCEFPANGIMGVPGINSLGIDETIPITLTSPSEKLLSEMKQIWKIVRSINSVTFKEDDYTKSTLSDNSYDLVYNFCVYEQLTEEEGQLLLKEMYRVSRKYVLFFVHNDKTILTLFKKIFSSNDKKIILKRNIQSILSFYNHVGLHVVTKERGYFDFPPWPDINMNLTGSLHKTNLEYKELCKQAQKLRPHVKTKKIDDIINGNFSESDDSSMIRLIDWWLKHMESKTPKFIKRWWAHHPYILLEKR
jgi:hypothetical protein